MNKKSGFTLIEVVLAISILSTLSVLVATSTSRALKAKKKIQAEINDVSSIRDTVKVMRADIQQIYNHFDYEKEILDQVSKVKKQNVVAGQNPNTPNSLLPQRENKREDPRTQFFGGENKISFVTMNQARMMASELQADFVEVGYEVKACKSLSKDKSTQCLYRRVQSILDNDIEKGGNEIVILENVTEFSLRYLVEGKEDWVKEWKSVLIANSTATKPVFPDAVEVNLGIETEFEGKPKKYSMQYVVPLHFPNNIKSTTSSSTTATSDNATNPGGTTPPPKGGLTQ